MKPTPSERDNLADDLVAARVGAGVSRAKIAQRAGVSRGLVQRVEEGSRMPSACLLRAYAFLCSLDADSLLLAWGHTPEDVLLRLQKNPQLCALVRLA